MLMDDDQYKDYDFYFIIGSDLLGTIDKWEESEKLKNEIKFIIFLRMGHILCEKLLPKLYIIVSTSFVASSSTEIRTRIHALRKYGKVTAETISQEKENKKREKDKAKEGSASDNSGNHQQREENNESDESDGARIDIHTIYKLVKLKNLWTCKLLDDSVSKERKRLETNYLGIYGIVPDVIIKYIIEHNLYKE